MAIRFRSQFETLDGQVYTIHIHDTDHTGDVTDLNVALPGMVISYAGGEDLFHAILPSTCTVPIVIENLTDAVFLENLATSDEGRFRLVVRKGDGDGQPLWWVGVITLDNIVIPHDAYPYTVEIKAVDGLQLLSRKSYDNTGSTRVRDQILYCLKAIGTDDLFETGGVDVTFLRYREDMVPDVATYDDAFYDVRVNPFLYNPDTGTYAADGMSLERFLTEMARMYNCRIYMAAGSFWFDPVVPLLNSPGNPYMSTLYADGTEGTDESYTRVTTFGASAGIYLRRASGWVKQYLPAVSKVTRPLDFGEGVMISNENVGGVALSMNGATSGTQVATYTFTSDNTIPAGSTFAISGRAAFDADYIGMSSNGLSRPRVNIRFKVGTAATGYRYLYRDMQLTTAEEITVQVEDFNTSTSDQSCLIWDEPTTASWTTTNTDRLRFGGNYLNHDKKLPNYVTGDDDQVNIPIDFTTPATPIELGGTVELQFILSLTNQNGGTATQSKLDNTAGDIVFSLRSGEGFNGATILYEASTSNNATEQRQEDAVQIGSQVVFTNSYYFNPSEVWNVNGGLPDWVSTQQTTAAGMHEIAVRDQLEYFSSPRLIFSGPVYSVNSGSFIHPAHCLYDTGLAKWFLVSSMTYQAHPGLYELELHECATDNTITITSDANPIGPRPRPPLEFAQDITKRIDRDTASHTENFIRVDSDITDLQSDVAEVRATSDGSGGQSSVLLSYLGDVKISGPSNGQILEYNSTAGRWGNVTPTSGTDNSLSETDQTIDEGVTRSIVLDGSAGNLTYFQITDSAGTALMKISNYGTILSIFEYFGLIAYRSTSTVKGSFALYEAAANGNNYIQFVAPDSLSANRVFTFPGDYGSSGDVLQSNGAGTLSWGTPFSYITLQSSFYSSDGNFDYVPIGGTLAETTSNQYYNIWTAPASGELVAATCICSTTTAGSTTITVRKYPIPQTLASDTQTVPSTAYTTASFAFTGATFSAGDRLQFGFDPTGIPGGVQITFLIKLNH